MNTHALSQAEAGGEPHHARAAGTALWLFMGVATTLFSLFIVAYAMRMLDAPDWSPITLPPQLWLSTALLIAGSVLMQRAGALALAGKPAAMRAMLVGGGAAAAAFVGSQLWGWQLLIDQRVMLGANPAASFFYVLTALHGLHVLGGLVAWSVAAQALSQPAAELPGSAWRIVLCGRYWHFLLVVWVALFAALALLTPEVVRFICGRG
ncbi:bb3-type cytochrome oxidase subunit III [Ideonella sp.]|uniref:cytochrome c oxidase subunit 3 n=1 Tax=Ideonella sp. TaxID=1929293 RepID=UPI002B49C7CF|nr:bb3-type cytochrome oxidase subunit III [Ideonella sp.]HJV69000.1 bb3-type cytochrome oxidase subunit III [Ideonella sp.]